MNGSSLESQGAGLAWYCARTQPKHEHIATGSLRSRLGLEVFNPRLKIERSTARGVVRVIEPLFPCYIFVRCQLDDCLDQVRYITGISSLVRFGQKIPPVPDEVVEELRLCFETDDPMAVEEQLRPGTEVTVAEGAFLGSQGIVVRVLPSKQRVQILLDFLGRATLTEVDRNSVCAQERSLSQLVPALMGNPGRMRPAALSAR